MGEIGFVGLGHMGVPMARRLLDAGHRIRGFDLSAGARERFAALDAAAVAVASGAEAATGADVLILMLPTSAIVRAVLVDDGALGALPAGATAIDMSSSEPLQTRALAERAGAAGVALIDAPVSGGVRGAQAGTLTIMAGGPADRVEAVRPLLEAMGRVVHAGDVGAGHALKAINNLLSATHLLASSEALRIGRAFGLDPERMLEAINGSSGRSWSTQHKLPDFVLPETFTSGFGLGLMVKDMGIACALGEQLGAAPALGGQALALWEQAARALPDDADHTLIARWVDAGEP